MGCPDGAASRSFAGFSSGLFLDTEGDLIGAFLFVERQSETEDPPEVLRAKAGIFRCPNNNCLAVDHVGEEDLGPVQRRGARDAAAELGGDSRRIRFRRNGEAAVTIRYPMRVAQRRSGRSLEVRGFAANCPTDPQTTAHMTAAFDNVFIGP